MSDYLELLSEKFGTTQTVMALMIGAYFFCVAFPILFPLLLAFRRTLAIKRKLLFLFTVSTICYGSVAFFAWGIQLPSTFYGVFVAPQMYYEGKFVATPIVEAESFMNLYGFFVYPVATAIFAVVIGVYLSGRWNRVVLALQKP
jgi:hypothetical protein